MAEVSCSVCVQLASLLGARGIALEPLLAGFPFDASDLREPRRRIAWDDFARLLERVSRALGGPRELETLALQYVRTRRPGVERVMAAAIGHARPLYLLGAQWVGPNLFLSTRAKLDDLPDGRIRQTIEILTPFRDSPEFFHLMRGALRVLPEELGQARADVELELAPRRGTFLIRPPARISLRGRLRSLLAAPRALPHAIAELSDIQAHLQEVHLGVAAVRKELDARTRALQLLHELGRDLSRHTQLLPLAHAAVDWLREHFQAAGALLFVFAEPGRAAAGEIVGIGAREGPASAVFPLRVGERSVGRVELFGSAPAHADTELVEDSLAMLALALDRAAGLAELARQAAELRSAVASRDEATDQLHRAQRLEALGRLAGGVAHDLNNVLTAIGGYAELARQELPASHPARADLEAIGREGERASALIKQVLAFSRPQLRVAERLDLNAAIEELLPMLRQLVPDNVRLVAELEKELGAVRADSAQTEQILINLVLNARDALPRGGTIRVTTRNEPAASPAEPARVLLRVSDDGVGMDASTAARAFEPFFTTKESGKGSGLGLSTVLDMVEQSRGTIELRSDPGRGTEVSIRLPRLAGSSRARPPEAALLDAPGGNETALVVEDDRNVRDVIRRILERKGYRVLEAKGGEEALRLADAERGRIDLLIADLVMPDMGGRELSRLLSERRQELAGTLLISGHSSGELDPLEGAGEPVLLRKPFAPAALLQAVRQILGPR